MKSLFFSESGITKQKTNKYKTYFLESKLQN